LQVEIWILVFFEQSEADMPELPEVETIKRGLQKNILNKKIINVIINRADIIKEPGIAKFKKELSKATIKAIIRRGKLIIISLSGGSFLIVHLRISGWLKYGQIDDKARVSFELSNGSWLNYMDQRVLGEIRLRRSYEDLKFLRSLGPEPFDLSPTEFAKIINGKKTKIKNLLLDQKTISGIGNIYAQEALFLARIDPRRPADSLKKREAEILHKKIVSVLQEAIRHQGSSVDTYRNIDGQPGTMEECLKVYGRKAKPCFACRKPIVKITLAGRGTCFCPQCQK